MQKMQNRFKELETFQQVFDIFLSVAKTYPSSVEASKLFSEYVSHIVSSRMCTEEEAKNIARSNISYYMGYYDERTQSLISYVYRQSLGMQK